MGNRVVRNGLTNPRADPGKIIGPMRLYELAIPNDHESERLAMRVDVAARHSGLADIELAGQPYDFLKVRLANPEVRPDPRWWHEEPGGEAVGFRFHLLRPIG